MKKKNEVDTEKGRIWKDVLISAWEFCGRTCEDFHSPNASYFQLKSALNVRANPLLKMSHGISSTVEPFRQCTKKSQP